jgi:acyl-CoA thioester hydrolase
MNPIFSYEMDVRWREMDALGHVNNAQFLSYVEETRVKWFNAMQENWQNPGSSPVVAAIHVDFRQPIHWPERIQVELFAVKRGSKSVTIGHRICSSRNNQHVYAEGYTVLVWIDRDGKTVLPPDYVAELFNLP